MKKTEYSVDFNIGEIFQGKNIKVFALHYKIQKDTVLHFG